MKNTLKPITVVTLLAVGWLGLAAWVVSDVSTAKRSIDAAARHQAPAVAAVVGFAKR